MWLVRSFVRHRSADALAILFIVFSIVCLSGPVVHAGFDRNQRCLANVNRIAFAFIAYVQDYDQRAPYNTPMTDYSAFKNLLLPYTKDNTIFSCPSTQNTSYKPNSAIANQLTTAFPNLDTVEILRDGKAHPDGKLTVAFLDGHVERGGVDQNTPFPDVLCLLRQGQIVSGFTMYAQDFDGYFPHYRRNSDLRQAMQRYVRSERAWLCPDTRQYYTIGNEIRGKSKSSFADLSPVVYTFDSFAHKSNVITTFYLDGYREQRNPEGIVVPSAFNESHRRLRLLARAYVAYTKAHGNRLPLFSNFSQLSTLLYPDIRASRTFIAPGTKPFEANTSLSGTLLSAYPEPWKVEILRDSNQYEPGYVTVAWLSGSSGFIHLP